MTKTSAGLTGAQTMSFDRIHYIAGWSISEREEYQRLQAACHSLSAALQWATQQTRGLKLAKN
jgi:hypothetical protein